MIGASITRDALYKRVERESKRMAPTEVIVKDSLTDISSVTPAANSGQSSNRFQGGRPKGSTNEKKWLGTGNYNACLKSICDNYANKIVAMRS